MSHQLAIQRLTGSTEASVTSLGDQYFRLKAMLGQTRAQQEALCGQVLSKYKGNRSVLMSSLYKVPVGTCRTVPLLISFRALFLCIYCVCDV